MSGHRLGIPVDLGAISLKAKGLSGVWSPVGKHEFSGSNPKIIWEQLDDLWSARIFVGFNVCKDPVWKMDDLVSFVKQFRTKQSGDPGATFIYQKGIYRDQPEKGQEDCGVIVEDSAQVVILNLSGIGYQKFKKEIIALAGEIAYRFEQRSVIVEFQRNGVSHETMGITP